MQLVSGGYGGAYPLVPDKSSLHFGSVTYRLKIKPRLEPRKATDESLSPKKNRSPKAPENSSVVLIY